MSRSGALNRRKHTPGPPHRVNETFEAPSLDGPHQKQVPPKAPKALPLLPQGSQQVLTKRESPRRHSPPLIPDDLKTAKYTKQRRDKRPVKTIEFQIHSFADMSHHSKKCLEAATLGRPRQRQVAPKGTKALLLPPLGSQRVPTSRKPLRKRRDKPPVETIQFQTYSFADMGDNSKKTKQANVFVSSYLQSEIIYAACKIAGDDAESETSSCSSSGWTCEVVKQKEIIYAHCKIVEDDADSGLTFKTPTIVKTGHLPTTSASLSSASSGWRSEPLRKVESASAA
jgi:hypothetical protein